ncbi:helix-turn-helix domain-containing protein [Acidisphaera sp. S103]|uniref:AraC family transcriptional regulator n=1 Tax=Acidisphaera sp. S103 TaxID=1747223 RepID=UPI00131CE1B2|nr:helix-turn-helix domain-containing protein [Acidisphaera sp. S103]
MIGQPRAYARHFRSAEDYAAFNGLGGIRMNGRAPRQFTARMAFMDLGDVCVRRGEATVGLSLIGATSNNHIFTFATEPARPRLMSGREVGHDVLFHPRPNEVFTTRSQSDEPFPWGSLVVRYDALASAGGTLVGRDVAPSAIDAATIRTSLLAQGRLLRLVRDVADLAATTPEAADRPPTRAALSGLLTEALVDCLSGGILEYDRAAVRRHRLIMSRVEAALCERDDAGLSIEDLCRSAGASRRTLHEVCMEFTGVPPMRYARAYRLKGVRNALLAADPRTETVTEIAMRFGFWQLARFSAAYRDAFAEAPSETLRWQG